jgi:hypothetical protein
MIWAYFTGLVPLSAIAAETISVLSFSVVIAERISVCARFASLTFGEAPSAMSAETARGRARKLIWALTPTKGLLEGESATALETEEGERATALETDEGERATALETVLLGFSVTRFLLTRRDLVLITGTDDRQERRIVKARPQ